MNVSPKWLYLVTKPDLNLKGHAVLETQIYNWSMQISTMCE